MCEEGPSDSYNNSEINNFFNEENNNLQAESLRDGNFDFPENEIEKEEIP